MIEIFPSIKKIKKNAWPIAELSQNKGMNPFLSYGFLNALEESESVSEKTGWQPFHIRYQNESSKLNIFMPCYIKSHSYGEYIFDHGWAQAYHNYGFSYYPKLLCAIPFTPVTGARFLADQKNIKTDIYHNLSQELMDICQKFDLSSFHINFCLKEETDIFCSLQEKHNPPNWFMRKGLQYHFINQDYRDFNEFLGDLNARKRKAVKKERSQALEAGLKIKILTGKEITQTDWDHFFAFYIDTGNRKWGTPYLNREFFSLLGQNIPDNLLLFFAMKGDKPIAGALNIMDEQRLYGRYWGASEYHPSLHFELCYYQAIEYAIENKIKIVEAGAQGEHKIARGYQPFTTYSLHHIHNREFAKAIYDYTKRESQYIEQDKDWLFQALPFKQK